MAGSILVVKVGGSLFDLPDLGSRLRAWLELQSQARVLLVPGGGPLAEFVRSLDNCHGLGEERSHWLALQAMRLNAAFLAQLLTDCRVVPSLEECDRLWKQGFLPVLDAESFARADEEALDRVPHSWEVTSDSVAARVAHLLSAQRLILLKSTHLPLGVDWQEAAALGLVDAHFPKQVSAAVVVDFVDFRSWSPP